MIVGPQPVPPPEARLVEVDYRHLIDRSQTDKTARYTAAAYEEFEKATGIKVVRTSPRPYLTGTPPDQLFEKGKIPFPFYVLAAGVKLDMPVKRWPHAAFEEMVALDKDRRWFQVGALHDSRLPHVQEPVRGATNLLGKTDLPTLIGLIAFANGVVCHLSLPMLIASATNTPCVAVAGGRENPWLFEDLGVTVLHTVGEMDCCKATGCWRCGAIPPHNDSAFPPNWLCKDPVDDGKGGYGRCMTKITPRRVLDALNAARDDWQSDAAARHGM